MTIIEADNQSIATPTVRTVARRSLFWVGIAIAIAVIAMVTFAATGSAVGGPPLSPTNPAPNGAMALAEVLKQQGVTVTPTSTLTETAAAISDRSDTTLVLYDVDLYLVAEQLEEAAGLAGHVVLIDPSFGQLQAMAPEVGLAGFVDGALDADCDIPAVIKAGVVSGGGFGFRLVDDSADAERCLGSGDDVFSLIQLARGSDRLTIIGTIDALSNEFIINDGNAAFALNLLGETGNLVWYLPSFEDLKATDPPSFAELTPDWVTPVLLLLGITALVAALWRGRRLGPLIVENLPVVVRASETMLGRARLYATGPARLRALDSLRIGAIERLAVACGLPRISNVEDVIRAVSAATGKPLPEVRRILLDANPVSDKDLVRLSDELLTLEHAVAAAVHPA